MKIENVEALWLRCPEAQPNPGDGSHRSNETILVVITDATGQKGFGEANVAPGSSGSYAAIVNYIKQVLSPILIGHDSEHINALWQRMCSGKLGHHDVSHTKSFPTSGRRGLTLSAISGVDMALWDLRGKQLATPIVNLPGGPCRHEMPVYANAGWSEVDAMGSRLSQYVEKGFKAVKMSVGAINETVSDSIARVRAARAILGDDIKIMVDAHASFSVPEAKRFCNQTEDLNLYWIADPISPDNKKGTAEVRQSTVTPIAAGSRETTRFAMRDLVSETAVDVLQPDVSMIGGISEANRVVALAAAHQVELAPYSAGSVLSFMAGLHIAFSSPTACFIDFSPENSLLWQDLIKENIRVENGVLPSPGAPGLGVHVNWEFVKEYQQ